MAPSSRAATILGLRLLSPHRPRAAERRQVSTWCSWADMLAAREKDGRVIAQGALNKHSISISILSGRGRRHRAWSALVATLSTTYKTSPSPSPQRFASPRPSERLAAAGWNVHHHRPTTIRCASNFQPPSPHMEKNHALTSAPREFSSTSARGLWGRAWQGRPPFVAEPGERGLFVD